jgi:hypothetical protein
MDRQSDRVRRVSPEEVNRRNREQTADRVQSLASRPAAISQRLSELEEEWDMERMLFAMTSINMLLGLSAGARNRRWLAWPVIVAGFQLQHAVQGWCPPVSLLRRLGVRTRQEIDSERVALKALRGDFRTAGSGTLEPQEAFAAALR